MRTCELLSFSAKTRKAIQSVSQQIHGKPWLRCSGGPGCAGSGPGADRRVSGAFGAARPRQAGGQPAVLCRGACACRGHEGRGCAGRFALPARSSGKSLEARRQGRQASQSQVGQVRERVPKSSTLEPGQCGAVRFLERCVGAGDPCVCGLPPGAGAGR